LGNDEAVGRRFPVFTQNTCKPLYLYNNEHNKALEALGTEVTHKGKKMKPHKAKKVPSFLGGLLHRLGVVDSFMWCLWDINMIVSENSICKPNREIMGLENPDADVQLKKQYRNGELVRNAPAEDYKYKGDLSGVGALNQSVGESAERVSAA